MKLYIIAVRGGIDEAADFTHQPVFSSLVAVRAYLYEGSEEKDWEFVDVYELEADQLPLLVPRDDIGFGTR